MGLYNFQARFVPFILNGAKKHTIRARRAHPDKPGNTLHLYTGLRTKHARLLMRVECAKVEEIRFGLVGQPFTQKYRVLIEGVELSGDEMEDLAIRDGFDNFAEMMKFWREPKNRLPFRGHIIHWR